MTARKLIRFCFFLAVVLAGPAWASPTKYVSMVVFGDSLSDTGNDFIATQQLGMVPAIPPSVTPHATYYQGRFSNGPVAVEYLWRLLSRDNGATVLPSVTQPPLTPRQAVSFAFGGSTTGFTTLLPGTQTPVPGLRGQVALFGQTLQGAPARQNALYVVWSGSNDYIQTLPPVAGRPVANPADVVGNVVEAIRALYALGARDFLVPNLPDMGLSPLLASQGAGPAGTELTKAHNAALNQALNGLASSLPKARFIRLNVFAIGATLVSTGAIITSPPALAYLGGPARPELAACLFVAPITCSDVPVTAPLPPFLFWDVLHPTTQVHGVLGLAMFSVVVLSGIGGR